MAVRIYKMEGDNWRCECLMWLMSAGVWEHGAEHIDTAERLKAVSDGCTTGTSVLFESKEEAAFREKAERCVCDGA